MASLTDSFDLGRLQLSSGQARQIELLVGLDGLEFGGQSYAPEAGRVPVLLDAARTSHGYSLRLRYETVLAGPCMRCLEDAGRDFEIDVREFDQPGDEDDDLRSPYLDGGELDLAAWARDSLVLDLPTQIVCREDCLGICAECGANMNDDPQHQHEAAADPRWAKLSELKLD
jgi:uncharacterized protein